MHDESRARAMELLGQFNDDLTRTIDAVFDTRWAEIEEVIALIAMARDSVITTRSLADISGLGRRAISRLIVRLTDTALVSTRPASHDRRAVEVVLSTLGRAHADDLRTRASALLRDSEKLAGELVAVLEADGQESPPAAADPLTLLLDAAEAGAKLVSYMPTAATQGRMAARQRAALLYIATHPDVRPGALAEPLEVSHAGVAYLVDQLCEKDFVRRHRNEIEGDQRAVVLRVTPGGLAAVSAVASAIQEERMPLSLVFQQIAAWCVESRVSGDRFARSPH